MAKSNEISRRQFSDSGQSWFSRRYACWANNHNGWSKMKKFNRRLFKRKYKQEVYRHIQNEILDMDLE